MKNRKEVDQIISHFRQRQELQLLSPRQIWRRDLHEAITALDWEERGNDPEVIALMAGLHLCNDNLDASHACSQKIEFMATGDYWHAIMHRMEQDYANSKYWYRQVGAHPVLQAMLGHTAAYLNGQAELDTLDAGNFRSVLLRFRDEEGWRYSDFVDLVRMQESGAGNDKSRLLLEGLQQLELSKLLQYTYLSVFMS